MQPRDPCLPLRVLLGPGHPVQYFAWKIPWTEEPGGLYSPWGHKDWDMTELLTHTHTHTHTHKRFTGTTKWLPKNN